MKELNWAIMGTGRIANDFADSMNNLHKIYGIASRNSVKAEAFKAKHDVQKAYGSYEEMLEDADVDVVYIATVNSQHYMNIMDCLNHNKHVLCEKAIWSNENDMKKACELSRSKNLFLGEAMTIYYMPLYKRIKKMINEGELGKIKFVQADFGSLNDDDPYSRFFSKELGGGAMLDIGTYALSFVLYFMSDSPYEIKDVISRYRTGVDEMWGIVLKNKEDEIGNVNLTFRAKLPKRGLIAGEKAYVTVFEYPRADKAEIVYPDGKSKIIKSKTIEEGDTARAMEYEIAGVEEAISNSNYAAGHLDLTMDVVSVMDRLMSQAE